MQIRLKPLEVLRQRDWPNVEPRLLKRLCGKDLFVEECRLDSRMFCVQHPLYGKVEDWRLWLESEMVAEVLDYDPQLFAECHVCRLVIPTVANLDQKRCPHCNDKTFYRLNPEREQILNEMLQKHLEQQKQEEERWNKIRALASDKGLVLVKLSARRYEIISRNTAGGIVSSAQGRKFTYEEGSVVFGPASYERCQDYLAEHAAAAPEDLAH